MNFLIGSSYKKYTKRQDKQEEIFTNLFYQMQKLFREIV
jgi:hypothetical protein